MPFFLAPLEVFCRIFGVSLYVYLIMYGVYRGVRSGYVLNQYQHSVRVHAPFDVQKLGLVSPHRGLTKPNDVRRSLYQHSV